MPATTAGSGARSIAAMPTPAVTIAGMRSSTATLGLDSLPVSSDSTYGVSPDFSLAFIVLSIKQLIQFRGVHPFDSPLDALIVPPVIRLDTPLGLPCVLLHELPEIALQPLF